MNTVLTHWCFKKCWLGWLPGVYKNNQGILFLFEYKYIWREVFRRCVAGMIERAVRIIVTIATETRLSAQNDISQEEVFNVWSAHFRVLRGGFHWKLWSIFFIRPRIEIERLRFFCNFFCGVISWLWFVNMVPFHIRSWNKWTELFNLDRDKIHNDGWRSGWY